MTYFDAVLIGSSRTLLPGPSFEVHGDRASLVVEARDAQERRLLEGMAPGGADEPAPPARLAMAREGGLVEIALGRPKTSWVDYYENVAMAIRENVRPAVTADAGRLTVRVMEAVRQSAEEGRTIALTSE
jgi:scyllo-inositol 2-dehydrogenase (NADP+)